MQGRQVAGIALVGVGISVLVIDLTGVGAVAILALGGLAFLAAYLATRSYGALVPGGILTGLGTALVLDDLGLTSDTALLGLAGGFLLIPLVQLVTGGHRDVGWWWPFIPGGILGTIGVAALADGRRTALVVSGALIVLGLFALWSGARQAGAARALREQAEQAEQAERSDVLGQQGPADPAAAGPSTSAPGDGAGRTPADGTPPEAPPAR